MPRCERQPSMGRLDFPSNEPNAGRHLIAAFGWQPESPRRPSSASQGDRVPASSSRADTRPRRKSRLHGTAHQLQRAVSGQIFAPAGGNAGSLESIARRHKVIFRAPLDRLHRDPSHLSLNSERDARRTAFRSKEGPWRRKLRGLRAAGSLPGSQWKGFAAVVATQLWHHQFMGGGLRPAGVVGSNSTSPTA